jgi:TonB family protein
MLTLRLRVRTTWLLSGFAGLTLTSAATDYMAATVTVCNFAYFDLRNHDTNAVDAKGVRHEGTSYNGTPAWLLDRLWGLAPYYPIEEGRQRHQGRGLVRMTIDLTTGYVTKATMVTSTGFPVLDRTAMAAFMTWRWRAGTWREIDLPVAFRLNSQYIQPPPGCYRMPQKWFHLTKR